MPEVLEHYRYWAEFPPLHLLVRAFVRFQPKAVDKHGADAMRELRALAGGPGTKVSRISDLPGWAKPKPWPMNVN